MARPKRFELKPHADHWHIQDMFAIKLFRNGRNQAVRIPVEFELRAMKRICTVAGDRLVIEPVRKRGLVALLKTMKPLEEAFPEIDDRCRQHALIAR